MNTKTRPLSDAARSILREVQRFNAAGYQPAKIEVCAAGTARTAYQLPSRTRAGRYRLIDRLIKEGYLSNSLRADQEWYNVYALQITAAGEAELA